MRDFANGNPYMNAGGDLRGRYAEAGGVNRYFNQQLRQARMAGDQSGMQSALAGRAQFHDYRDQNPGMFGQGGPPMGGPPMGGPPMGAPTPGPEGRQFANGNPYYNAQGELRNRYAAAGGVNQFFQGKIKAANQAGNYDQAQQFQQARHGYKEWNSQQDGQYGGDQTGEHCPYCGK